MEVLSAGIIVADIVVSPVDQFPERGQLQQVENADLYIGGLAAATARSLCRLGVAAGVLGKVGTDQFGDYLEKVLEEAGVDMRGFLRDENTTTCIVIALIAGDGERSFLVYPGSSAEFQEEDIDFDLVKQAKIFHYGGPASTSAMEGEPLARVMKRARDLGCKTSIDTVWDSTGRWMETLGAAIGHTDYLFTSYEEGRELSGTGDIHKMAETFLDMGVELAIIKMGPEGSYIRSRDTEVRIPAHQVDAVDTTGAGDCYVGGFLKGLVEGWPLEKTARFANAVGGLATTQRGGSEAVTSIEAVEKFTKEHPLRSLDE